MPILVRYLLFLAALICLHCTLPAQEMPTVTLTVEAGAQDRLNTPVSVTLEELKAPVTSGYQLVEIVDDQAVAKSFQTDSERLYFVLDGKTAAGATRIFELQPQAEKETESLVSTKKADGAVCVQIAGRDVFQYAYDPVPLPEGVSDIYQRSGFIHPLWTPKGEVLTRIQPPDHYHHYGIWNPWTHTSFESRELDFWNLYKGEATVRNKAVLQTEAGPVYGGFSALLEHVDLTAPDPTGAKTALHETWTVKAWNADPEQDVWLLDFTSTLNPATDSIFTILAYRYQGFGFRATEKWNDNNVTLLTDKGMDKSNGNATRARWCDINGVSDVEDGTSGILFLTHPSNYNFPEQLRIWPVGANGGKENVFFNFNPAQEQDWVLHPGQTYQLKYRMLVYDGKISEADAERYWYDFAYPPKVSVRQKSALAGKKVLVYTKNGEGYVHDNLAESIKMVERLGEEHGFAVDASDDPAVMTEENLKQYDALIFSNTNNETFDTDAQKLAFQRYMQAGGGFVGIHSASGSERDWDWFAQMLGGRFRRHPPFQEFDIKVLDSGHPSTAFLGDTWQWEDECYYLTNLNPGMQVLLAADLTTVKDKQQDEYPGTNFGNLFPICWQHEFDGGRQWYTALGHSKEFYSDPTFVKHIMGGIQWVLEGVKPLDYSRADKELR